VTRLPLCDERYEGRLAHLTYADAVAVARRLEAVLVTREQVHQVLRGTAYVLPPVILPTREMLAAMPPRGLDETERAYQTRIREDMGSDDWAQIHDGRVFARLATMNWDGVSLVANAGKHWVRGAAPGRARICGWWDGAKMIQLGIRDNHHAAHYDYATTTVLMRSAQHAPAARAVIS